MKKSIASKAKLIRERTTVEIDGSDIMGWLRAHGNVPKDARDIFVSFRLEHSDVNSIADNEFTVEIDQDRPVTVTWLVETTDDTGF